MLGAEKKEDPRWLAWLETTEADDLLAYNDPDVFALCDQVCGSVRRQVQELEAAFVSGAAPAAS